MAKIKTVSATYDRKVNLGDFNSVHIAMTVWADLEEGDNDEKVARDLREVVKAHVLEEVAKELRDKNLYARTQEMLFGLPVEEAEKLKPVINSNGDVE